MAVWGRLKAPLHPQRLRLRALQLKPNESSPRERERVEIEGERTRGREGERERGREGLVISPVLFFYTSPRSHARKGNFES